MVWEVDGDTENRGINEEGEGFLWVLLCVFFSLLQGRMKRERLETCV